MKLLVHCHPLLVAAAPIVHLHGRNQGYFSQSEVACWLGIYTSIAAIALTLAMKWVRRPAPSALIVSWGLLLFFAYGHAFESLWRSELFPRQRYLHAALFALSCILFLLVAVCAVRTRIDLTKLSRFLTVGVSIFLAISLAGVARNTVSAKRATAALATPTILAVGSPQPRANEPPLALPDIYYIILDGYAREDVLRHHYGFDNGPFLNYLRGKGFYVAPRSCANYWRTCLSLSSSLHLRYHDSPISYPQKEPFYCQMIRHPLLAQLLQARGYCYVHMRTNWAGTYDSPLADVTLNGQRSPLTGNLAYSLRQTTMLRLWHGMNARMEFVEAIQSTFQNLPSVADMDGPTFTLAHVLAPHPPYSFGRDGRPRTDIDQTARSSYVDQIVYVNGCVQRVIDRILARSTTPPIIVLQSDHGSGYFVPAAGDEVARDEEYFRERLPILNAYLVPDHVRARLYPTISPVNSFRILLSELFQFSFPPLPDQHFISLPSTGPQVHEVTDLVREGVPTFIAEEIHRAPSRH